MTTQQPADENTGHGQSLPVRVRITEIDLPLPKGRNIGTVLTWTLIIAIPVLLLFSCASLVTGIASDFIYYDLIKGY